MTTYDWGGSARRRDCRYALEIMRRSCRGQGVLDAEREGQPPLCERRRAQAAYVVGDFKIPGATRIVQRVICRGKGQRDWCSARGLNSSARVTRRSSSSTTSLRSSRSCQIRRSPQGPGWAARSRSTTQQRTTWASRATSASSTEPSSVARPPLCPRFSDGTVRRSLPCPNGPGQITVRTHELRRGHPTARRAGRTAGNTALGPVIARIDNTPPARVDIGVEGGDAWRNRNDFPPSGRTQPRGIARQSRR